ncbi:hypothetical protein IAU60_002431 [Kwoniella sp. DSM 27419]
MDRQRSDNRFSYDEISHYATYPPPPPPPSETYFERLKRLSSQGPVSSSAHCGDYYLPSSTYSQHQYPQPSPVTRGRPPLHRDMSTAILPPQQHFGQGLAQHFDQKPLQLNMQALSTRQATLAAPPDNNVQKRFTPPQAPSTNDAPMSRFQQLLHLKMAAESASPASYATPSSDGSSPLDVAFAQAQSGATDTVFHKEFFTRHQSSSGPSHTVTGKVHEPPAEARPSQSSLQPSPHAQSRFNPGAVSPIAPVTQTPYPAPPFQTQQPPQRRPSNPVPGRPQFPYAASMMPPQQRPMPFQQTTPSTQAWNGQYNVPSSTFADAYPPRNESISSGSQLSAPSLRGSPIQPLVKIEPQWAETAGMNGWTQNTTPSFDFAQTHQLRPTPAFTWNVSEVRSSDQGQAGFDVQRVERTPALSPSHPMQPSASTTGSSPVTPTGPSRYLGASAIPSAYPTVKIEPDTHLTVPYRAQSRTSNHNAGYNTGSALLEYGHHMFTNMNGGFQLPGAGMYMASASGGDMPSTLADGMAEGNGDGSANGHGGDGGWGNGNGNGGGHGGEGSGSASGSGGHGGGDDGDGSGSGSGGDGGDQNGNGTPSGKPKKLALACHFCRRRKLKCNGIRPRCDNCTKRNETCSWDDEVRRRGPGKATKERREKAAREAIAAGLTNSNSLGALSGAASSSASVDGNVGPGELPIADAIATLPAELKGEHHHDHLHSHGIPQHHQLGEQSLDHPAQHTHHHQHPHAHQHLLDGSDALAAGLGGSGDMTGNEIPIDPALAALSAAVMPVPGTLAELEVKKGEKRKSTELPDGVFHQGEEKRLKVENGSGGVL